MKDNNRLSLFLFLLYVGTILVFTFIKQEFVLLPEIQSFDLLGEEARVHMVEKWQKWRWVSFLIAPIFLLLRLGLVSLCLYVGSFFSYTANKKFKDWWDVSMVAQSVLILYGVILCSISVIFSTKISSEISKYTSLLFLGGDNIEQWIRLPLSAFNIFEITYWIVMAKLVSARMETGFGKSFKFVLSSYGVGYLFYIVLLMFLMLYLN